MDTQTLLGKIKDDFPELKITNGRKYAFRPPRTIIIGLSEEQDSLLLLHELGHALCGHRDFRTDAQRLRMEREAWGKARELAKRYNIDFDEVAMECELDTYREWLDKQSRCPSCKLTRYQTPDGNYHCPRCENLT